MSQTKAVYFNLAADAQVHGSLFQGLHFWVHLRVPSRSAFVNQLSDNGGKVMKLEKDADILIADHLRRDSPSGSLSWTWIEACIREGTLVDKARHPASKADQSMTGSSRSNPGGRGRIAFSLQEDQLLYAFVEEKKRQGESVGGNKIYKEYYEQTQRHTWQSYRARYYEHLRHIPPSNNIQVPLYSNGPHLSSPVLFADDTARLSAGSPAKKHATPSQQKTNRSSETGTDVDGAQGRQGKARAETQTASGDLLDYDDLQRDERDDRVSIKDVNISRLQKALDEANQILTRTGHEPHIVRLILGDDQLNSLAANFSDKERNDLYRMAPGIQNTTIEAYPDMWKAWSRKFPNHSADEWRAYYEQVVRPEWRDNASHELLINNKRPYQDVVHRFLTSLTLESSTPAESEAESARLVQHKNSMARDKLPIVSHIGEDEEETASAPIVARDPIVVISSPETGFPHSGARAGTKRNLIESTSPGTYKKARLTSIPPLVASSPRPATREKTGHSLIQGMAHEERAVTPVDSQDSDIEMPFFTPQKQPTLRRSIPRETISQAVSSPQLGNWTLGRRSQAHNPPDVIDLTNVEDDGDNAGGWKETAFKVYESNAVPEGEKENVLINKSGSPTYSKQYKHIRVEGALEVFTDPPQDFKLQTIEPVLSDDGENDGRHDIDNIAGIPVGDVVSTNNAIQPSAEFEELFADLEGASPPRNLATATHIDERIEQGTTHGPSIAHMELLQATRASDTAIQQESVYDTQFLPEAETQLVDLEISELFEDGEDELLDGTPGKEPSPHEQYDYNKDLEQGVDIDDVLAMPEPDIYSEPDLERVAHGEQEPESYASVDQYVYSDVELHGVDGPDGPDVSPAHHDMLFVKSDEKSDATYPQLSDSQDRTRDSRYLPKRQNGVQNIKSRFELPVCVSPPASRTAGRGWNVDEGIPTKQQNSALDDAHLSLESDDSSPGFETLRVAPRRMQSPSRINPPQGRNGPSISTPNAATNDPRLARSPISADEAASQIEAFVKEQVAQGHDEDVIFDALHATSLDEELARVVLSSIKRGRGFPEHTKGVFLEADDDVMSGSNARDMRKLEEFHGLRIFNARRQFLFGS